MNMNRLKLYFGLILIILLKMMMYVGIIVFLILFTPIFIFINKKSFHYCMDELYKTLN